jgi:hypothetical protein
MPRMVRELVFRASCMLCFPSLHLIYLLLYTDKDYPSDAPPPLRFIRSCSSSLAAATLHKLEAAFHAPVLEGALPAAPLSSFEPDLLWRRCASVMPCGIAA